MRTIKCDENNNPVFGTDGNLTVLQGINAIGQSAVQYCKARRNEMVFDYDRGIPFSILAWGGTPNETQFEAAHRATLLQVPGVTAVTEFEVIRVGDVLKYTATLQTVSGETSING